MGLTTTLLNPVDPHTTGAPLVVVDSHGVEWVYSAYDATMASTGSVHVPLSETVSWGHSSFQIDSLDWDDVRPEEEIEAEPQARGRAISLLGVPKA